MNDHKVNIWKERFAAQKALTRAERQYSLG